MSATTSPAKSLLFKFFLNCLQHLSLFFKIKVYVHLLSDEVKNQLGRQENNQGGGPAVAYSQRGADLVKPAGQCMVPLWVNI